MVSQKVKAALVVGVPLVVCLAVHLSLQSEIRNQRQRNEILQREVVLLDREIQEIKGLDRSRRKLISLSRAYEMLQSYTRRFCSHRSATVEAYAAYLGIEQGAISSRCPGRLSCARCCGRDS